MKAFLTGLILGILVGASGYWYLAQGRQTATVRQAQDSTAAALERTVTAVQAKLQAWHLNSGEIKDELAHTGKVIRRSARDFGTTIADATADARITSTIKAKIALNRDLSVWHISVSTTDGRVTLAGTVASHDQIGKAMLLALDTDGVREVTSTLQVRKPA